MAVTKILSFQAYVICRRGTKQLGGSSGSIFPLFPMKVSRDHAYKSWGKHWPLAHNNNLKQVN